MYLCGLDSGEFLTGRQSPVGAISSLPTDLGRFCLVSYKSMSSVASPSTSNRGRFPLQIRCLYTVCKFGFQILVSLGAGSLSPKIPKA